MVATKVPYVSRILPVADNAVPISGSSSRVASALRCAAYTLRSQLEDNEDALEQSKALCRVAHDLEVGIRPTFNAGPSTAVLNAAARDIGDARALIRSVDLAVYAACGDLQDSKVVDALAHINRMLVVVGRLLQSASGRLA